MNKDLTLVIMAAGMGSRFGGLKQIEPVGPNGEFIIDYSIYDAIKAGFNKVVFIIKKSFEKEFKETIGKRIEGKIKVEYAYQEMDDVPEGTVIPEGREKPFGTGHALYTARNYIHEPFAVISADDFYGNEAFQDLGTGLQNTNNYIIIGYQIGSTLTENGSVKRGVIFEENGQLKKIVESLPVLEGQSVIIRTAGKERTKAEIKRDFEYLNKTWETIVETTMQSIAPALIHEEANLIKTLPPKECPTKINSSISKASKIPFKSFT